MPDKINYEPPSDVTGADASKLNGVTVPALGGPGSVLTVNPAGTGLEYDVPAAGVMLASTTPAAVGTAAVGTGTTAARSDHVHALPSTAVSAGSYPAVGQIPTFTVGADGRLTAAGSSTTITSPAISNPTFSGTEGGTRTIGGSPTLGVNLAAGGFKVTGLGAPTAASSDAATAAYAEAQKTGGAGPPFYLNTGQSFVANGYVGIGGDGSSTLVQNVVPWRVPAPGVIRDMSVFGFANAPSTLHVLIYKATNPTTTPTYSATALDTTVSSGTNTGSDTTHSVSVNAGDLIVGFCGTSWSANGAQISFRYIPN